METIRLPQAPLTGKIQCSVSQNLPSPPGMSAFGCRATRSSDRRVDAFIGIGESNSRSGNRLDYPYSKLHVCFEGKPEWPKKSLDASYKILMTTKA
jgi:hypothetical protein